MATATKMLDQAPARELPTRSDDTAAQLVDQSVRATSEWLDAESSLASLWLDLTHAQLEQQFETLQMLLDCRDWRTVAKVQQTFINKSLDRLNQTLSRHRELTGGLVTQLLSPDGTRTKAA